MNASHATEDSGMLAASVHQYHHHLSSVACAAAQVNQEAKTNFRLGVGKAIQLHPLHARVPKCVYSKQLSRGEAGSPLSV